jgi:hypothetical protein
MVLNEWEKATNKKSPDSLKYEETCLSWLVWKEYKPRNGIIGTQRGAD